MGEVLGYEPGGSEGGRDGRLARGHEWAAMPPGAAVAVAREEGAGLAVPDAVAFAREVASEGPSGVAALCDLAAADRLLCLAVAASALGDAGTPPAWDPVDPAAAGRAALADLSARAAAAGVPPGTVAAFGPLAVFARTRGAVALGVAGVNGLRADSRLRGQTVARLREVADRSFADLVRHPDAAGMVKGGRAAAPDRRGFRACGDGAERARRRRDWLAAQFADAEDRLGLPVPVPAGAGGGIDARAADWPVWAVATAPLAAYADLQAAEHLAHALRAGGDVHPRYSAAPDPASAGPDLAAYRRFRDAGLVPPCFAPHPGHAFVRLTFRDLPLVAVAARSGMVGGGGVLDAVRAGRRAGDVVAVAAGLGPGESAVLAGLVATGAGDAAVAAALGRATGTHLAAGDVALRAAALIAAAPELAGHLRDRTLAALAKFYGVAEAELAALVGFAGASGGPSAARRVIDSGFADAAGGPTRAAVRERVERVRRTGLRPAGPIPAAHRRALANGLAPALAETVLTATGRVFAGRAWAAARSAVLTAAGDAVLLAAFALAAAGVRVAAVTPSEILAEVPEDVGIDVAGETVGWAVREVFGVPHAPGAETVALW